MAQPLSFSVAVSLRATVLAFLLSGCGGRAIPQSKFYCLDVPSGRTVDVRHVLDATAKHLDFSVSEGTFVYSPDNVLHTYELYGKGISLMVQSAIGGPARVDHMPTFNSKRYSVQAYKSGLWQRATFGEALDALAIQAVKARMGWSKAPDGKACAT